MEHKGDLFPVTLTGNITFGCAPRTTGDKAADNIFTVILAAGLAYNIECQLAGNT